MDRLLSQLLSTCKAPSSSVSLQTDIVDTRLHVDTMIPLSLIVNELVSNSFKHAFRPDSKGKIFVGLSRSQKGVYKLVVKDNGMGLPEGFDINSIKTLGMQLVTALTEQLQGKLNVLGKNGSKFTVSFLEYRPDKK